MTWLDDRLGDMNRANVSDRGIQIMQLELLDLVHELLKEIVARLPEKEATS